jgi:hypothetical protein
MYEAGVDTTQEFGAAVYLLQKTTACPAAAGGGVAEASANISGALFQQCGQRGWPTRGCLNVGPQQHMNKHRYEWETHGEQVSIRDTTIVDGYNAGLRLDRVHGVSAERNVVARVKSFGVMVEGQRNRLRDNLIIHVADGFDGGSSGTSTSWTLRWSSGMYHCYGLHHTGRGGMLSGNVIAGVQGMAVLSDGYEWSVETRSKMRQRTAAPLRACRPADVTCARAAARAVAQSRRCLTTRRTPPTSAFGMSSGAPIAVWPPSTVQPSTALRQA